MHFIRFHPVNKPMLLIDSAGLVAAELAAQRFWFSRAGERIPKHRVDEPQRSWRPSPVRPCPVLQVLKEMRIHNHLP